MADMLCSTDDLASLLGLGDTIDTDRATLLIECGTAVVQAAAGYRLVRVVDGECERTGTASAWLALPEHPVVSVASVELDGEALTAGTDYRLFGSTLRRTCGWLADDGDLSRVSVVYTHGYDTSDQRLQFARGAVLGLIRDVYGNPEGLRVEKLDDWSATYAELSRHMDGTPALRKALRRFYRRQG